VHFCGVASGAGWGDNNAIAGHLMHCEAHALQRNALEPRLGFSTPNACKPVMIFQDLPFPASAKFGRKDCRARHEKFPPSFRPFGAAEAEAPMG
jgi:hypothetical protein